MPTAITCCCATLRRRRCWAMSRSGSPTIARRSPQAPTAPRASSFSRGVEGRGQRQLVLAPKFMRRDDGKGALMAEEAGLITRQSRHPVSETLQRLEGALAARGFMAFCRIDHSAAAAAVGETLLPRTVLIYGNPKIGTAAMTSFPTLAIDLPAKLLVWQDDAGRVWVTW